MKEEKNEELQSRREFFKKAAKAALPVVGAVVLSSLPIAQAKAVTGCYDDSCALECGSGCSDSCYGSCKGTCNSSCKMHCKNFVSY